jgi:phosphate transport system substrate-binding protein
MKISKIKISSLIILSALMVLAGCNQGKSPTDTPTTGYVTISVDETYKPLIESEVNTFESIYKYAKVNVQYKPEADVFNDLMNDTIRVVIVSRTLNQDELEQFKKWEIVPRINKIAYDGIALIGSKDLRDTVFSIDKIKSLLSGKDLDKSLVNTKVVFDNTKSSTLRYLSEKTGVAKFSSNCFALNSNLAVLDYVAKEKNCIGIIGSNWISDPSDTTNLSFLKTIKVLEIAQGEAGESYKPYQAYIAEKIYPLYREVYVLSKEAYNGLGTGFTGFLASDRGQRIVLRFGLVPATMPVRLVELRNEKLTE